MSVMTFDTLKYAKNLKTHGFNEQQAEALAEAQKEALDEILSAQLATKNDLLMLESKIEKRLVRLELMIVLLYIVILIPQIKGLV